MECKPGVLEINAIDLIKVMKKENDTECNKMAYTMALDHLLRGAMEGADNEPYITLYGSYFVLLQDDERIDRREISRNRDRIKRYKRNGSKSFYRK